MNGEVKPWIVRKARPTASGATGSGDAVGAGPRFGVPQRPGLFTRSDSHREKEARLDRLVPSDPSAGAAQTTFVLQNPRGLAGA